MLARLRPGADIFGTGRYGDAANNFESLRQAALAEREDDLAARATGNLGGCQFALHQYQTTLRTFLEAHRLADQAGDASYAAVSDVHIASLYFEMGELEAAAQWIEGALERMSGKDRRDHLPQLLIQLATLRARQYRVPEASELFRQGTDAADRAGDLELYAIGWDRLGEEFLKRGDLPQSEAPLLEAYRVRELHRLALEGSCRNLGRLRLAQGDLASASALLDRAAELAARPNGPIPSWDVYHFRGRVRPFPLSLFTASTPRAATGLVLPRLVASGAELDHCARTWDGQSTLLLGAGATRRNLAEQMRRNPAVGHFATHVLESSERPPCGTIALSLTEGKEAELPTPFEIAHWRIDAGLVVLSGCYSAQGAALPGTGLMGLTRAWLAAGVRAVVSSRWPTPDEDRPLFKALYRNLRTERRADPGEALRTTQLETIRSGGWYVQPRYWGAYYLIGGE